MKKITLHTKTKRQILAELKKRPFENLANIAAVEKFLLKTRGYVFKMPKPGTPVILLVSGGIDSIITWGILLEKYHLETYPLFIFRDKKRSLKEEAAVDFFSEYFTKKYPKLVQPTMKFSTQLSPPEIVAALKNYKDYYHPQRLLELVTKGQKTLSSLPHFYPQRILPFLHLFYCLVYSDYLYDHSLKRINTIFTGIMVGDGTVVPSQTLTSMRNALLSACSVTANYDVQYCSLAMEKELGFWFEKGDFIKIGAQLNLPLEKTWSCYLSGKYQCGDRCLTCQSRRLEFAKAGVPDKTLYAFQQKGFKKHLQWFKKTAMLLFKH